MHNDETNMDSTRVYYIPSDIYDKLELQDETRNLVAAAMIYLGCGPARIEEDMSGRPISELLDYLNAAKAYRFTADYKVERGV